MLSKQQWEIIEHRLSVDDCIVEVLIDAGYNETEIAKAIEFLLEKGRNIEIDDLTDEKRVVFIECIEGCTFFAGARFDFSGTKYNKYVREFMKLVDFFNCEYPCL